MLRSLVFVLAVLAGACASSQPRVPLSEHLVVFDDAGITQLRETTTYGRFNAFLIFGDARSDMAQAGPVSSSSGTVTGSLSICSQIYPREGRQRHYMVIQIVHTGAEWGLTNRYRLPINNASIYPVQALQDDRYRWVRRAEAPRGYVRDYIGEVLDRDQTGAFDKVYETRIRAADGSYAPGLPVRVRISAGLMGAINNVVTRTPNTNRSHMPPCAPQTEFGFRSV